ncbi:hypothetical protein BX600DRAFT_428680 [Xylariales sp. PMI_506]|nr:hypothetical protein BX600DRAFT_428680 [Xylariales sp. PMI_506]
MVFFWGAVSALWFVVFVAAQDPPEVLPTFGDVVNILGAMERTDQDFQDGLALDLFSPKNRTLVVQKNTNPLPGHFVTGSTGEGFIALSPYSYVIKMNETANDLIAKIEIPYVPENIQALGVQESNTYVGTLASDGMSWVVNEATRNVHRSENNTRIIKMVSLDGEYLLLGRTSVDTTNIFVQYGQGATRTVNVTAGGRQEAEFVDGLRFSMVAQQNTTMNVDIKDGVPVAAVPPGLRSLNSFAWVMNTSNQDAAIQASLKVPVNKNLLAALDKDDDNDADDERPPKLTLAKRPLGSNCTTMFQVVNTPVDMTGLAQDGRISATNITQIDGEYIVLVGA